MAWGSAQEASALFSLMHLFPHSQLQEVGLCWVDPRHQIPAAWGIPIDDLPPLGASPDGMIRHKAAPSPPPPRPPPSPAQIPTPTDLLSQDTATALPQQLGSVSASAQAQSTKQPAVAAASPALLQQGAPVDAEFEALLNKLEMSSRQAAACSTAHQPNQAQPHQAEHVNHVPHLPLQQPRASHLHATAAPSQNRDALHRHRLQQHTEAVQSASDDNMASAEGGPHPAGAVPLPAANSLSQHQDWFEAVEIKNVCPFRELRDITSNGKPRRRYHLSDPGPYSRVSFSCCNQAGAAFLQHTTFYIFTQCCVTHGNLCVLCSMHVPMSCFTASMPWFTTSGPLASQCLLGFGLGFGAGVTL